MDHWEIQWLQLLKALPPLLSRGRWRVEGNVSLVGQGVHHPSADPT